MRLRCGLFGLALLCLRRHQHHHATAFHPRSDHNGRYDFKKLIKHCPELAAHVFVSPKTREETVDWSSPDAVSAVNKALLMLHYGVSAEYAVPAPFLSAGVPGRADYVHHLLNDLVEAPSADGTTVLRGLDIGTGANAVYPLLVTAKYPNVEMVATELDPAALAIARRNLQCSPHAASRVSLRLQPSALSVLANIIQADERFDFVMCNPPFFDSRASAEAAQGRKLRNLSSGRNFAGTDSELHCRGGELGFITRMMDESVEYRESLGWVTTLVSKGANLDLLLRVLRALPVPVRRVEVVPLEAGQKSSRILAWRF